MRAMLLVRIRSPMALILLSGEVWIAMTNRAAANRIWSMPV